MRPLDHMEELIAHALQVRERAHAPYSGYAVGCALLADGAVFQGANVENASYGLALCAERSAVASAVAHGARVIQEVAVVTASSPPAAPCGMCLQTLTEFSPDPAAVRIHLVNPEGERHTVTLAECLPYGFRRDQLRR